LQQTGKGEQQMSTFRRWLIMACLCLSGEFIFMLPFLREIYHIPLQKALDLSNTQFGVLMSAYGIVAMLSYFPGGWLADRVSPRKLLTISLVSTGIAGFYLSTFPSYAVCIVLHAFWGLSTIFTFWAALIKATRDWAPSTEQGRAFGILECGRGFTQSGGSTIFLALFAYLGSTEFGLAWVIVLHSAAAVLVGVMAWFTLEDSMRDSPETEEPGEQIRLREAIQVLKMPVVWLIAIVILAAYSAYWASYYFAPYATDVFMMSVVFGGALSVGKMWIRPLFALGGGFFADKMGPSRIVGWCFVIAILSFVAFIFTPGRPNLVLILVINTAIAALAIFALRGVYFALLEEGGVPLAVTGTAAGVASVIGFTPDIFMPMVGGVLLDRYPGALGYRYLFIFTAGLCILGLLAAVIILRRFAGRKNILPASAQAAN
jgi:predicted MFS family arabinose efflux permease